MKKLVISLLLISGYAINAQSQSEQFKALSSFKHLDVTKSKCYRYHENNTSMVQTKIKNSSTGYVWGPLGFPSTNIIRTGKDFSIILIKVDELPMNVRHISYNGAKRSFEDATAKTFQNSSKITS
jgi:hypothetical protein